MILMIKLNNLSVKIKKSKTYFLSKKTKKILNLKSNINIYEANFLKNLNNIFP